MTRYNLDKGAHSVYSLRYHLVLVTKYRKKIFTNYDIIKELVSRTRKISKNFEVEIVQQRTDKDHIHILFKCSPKVSLTKYINSVKGATSRVLRNRFPEIQQKIWKDCLWSPSYCLLTTGEVSLNKVIEYVRNQGKK